MKTMRWLLLLLVVSAPLAGCVVYQRGPAPHPNAVWVPGHYGPEGGWHPGHWG